MPYKIISVIGCSHLRLIQNVSNSIYWYQPPHRHFRWVSHTHVHLLHHHVLSILTPPCSLPVTCMLRQLHGQRPPVLIDVVLAQLRIGQSDDVPHLVESANAMEVPSVLVALESGRYCIGAGGIETIWNKRPMGRQKLCLPLLVHYINPSIPIYHPPEVLVCLVIARTNVVRPTIAFSNILRQIFCCS